MDFVLFLEGELPQLPGTVPAPEPQPPEQQQAAPQPEPQPQSPAASAASSPKRRRGEEGGAPGGPPHSPPKRPRGSGTAGLCAGWCGSPQEEGAVRIDATSRGLFGGRLVVNDGVPPKSPGGRRNACVWRALAHALNINQDEVLHRVVAHLGQGAGAQQQHRLDGLRARTIAPGRRRCSE